VPALNKTKLQSYMRRFPTWVTKQNMTASMWSCDSDVRIDHPFPEEPSVFAFWAAHNCNNYSLLLTVVFSTQAMTRLAGYYGASMTQNGCSKAANFGDSYACEFELKTRTNFGLLFSGGFTPIFYLTEWHAKEQTWINTIKFW